MGKLTMRQMAATTRRYLDSKSQLLLTATLQASNGFKVWTKIEKSIE